MIKPLEVGAKVQKSPSSSFSNILLKWPDMIVLYGTAMSSGLGSMNMIKGELTRKQRIKKYPPL